MIFLFKWRHTLSTIYPLCSHTGSRCNTDRQREFQGVDFPVTAHFDVTTQCQKLRKHRVAVPAFVQVLGFWPGVGVKQKMLLWQVTINEQQPPEGTQLRPDQNTVFRLDQTAILTTFGKTCLGAVNTNDQVFRKVLGKLLRASSGATTRIKNKASPCR